MTRLYIALLFFALSMPALADMYPDASNAVLPVARTNLGLGTMAPQNAPSVAITGGTISGLNSLTVSGNLSSPNGILSGATSPAGNWLDNFMAGLPVSPNYGISLGPTTGTSQVIGLMTPSGQFGVVAGAQSKGCTVASPCNNVDNFAVGAFSINNAQTGGATQQNVWSYFGVVTALPGASNVGSGYTHGIEQDIVNKGLAGQPGAAPKVTPYNPNPLYMTSGMVLASGSGSLSATEQGYEGPASIALEIASNCSCSPTSVGNTPTFKSGIVFQAYALTGGVGADADGTITDAISLPRLAGINFWNSGDTTSPAGSIYSAMTSATPHGYNIRFDNTGVAIETNIGFGQGNPILFVSPSAGGTCYEQITAGAGLMVFATKGAANCTNYYNANGASGNYVFQVNAAAVASFSASGYQFNNVPTAAGAGGLFVCVDTAGNIYKKATCP